MQALAYREAHIALIEADVSGDCQPGGRPSDVVQISRRMRTGLRRALWRYVVMAAMAASLFQLGGCRRRPEGAAKPLASTSSDLAHHCDAFVAFSYGCGIGRPPTDPTVDVVTQRNNEFVIRREVAAQCRLRRRPYDEGLIRCFLDARGSCPRYQECADRVIKRRPPASQPGDLLR
jgi:hypothetical protein